MRSATSCANVVGYFDSALETTSSRSIMAERSFRNEMGCRMSRQERKNETPAATEAAPFPRSNKKLEVVVDVKELPDAKEEEDVGMPPPPPPPPNMTREEDEEE
mmetsp:Transcript_13102/g.30517  ORF Transcript_13102/g.30517 Transcript_13102/m.30517 type:complete len:104 (+) Transcript_13102:650-961(+)